MLFVALLNVEVKNKYIQIKFLHAFKHSMLFLSLWTIDGSLFR